MTDDNIEITVEQYERLRDSARQSNAEDWMPVIRRDSEAVDARPVDRQDGIREAERIESDQWLIRESTGETYTVSNETFEHNYESQSALTTERFTVDLSWDGSVLDDDTGTVQFDGRDVVAEIDVLIDNRSQTVISMDVVKTYTAKTDKQWGVSGIPIELLHDSPMFNRVDNVAETQNDE